MTKRIATILTVFNRKEKTLACLKTLYEQLPIEGYEVDVYLTNDGCTDGTREAVAEQFPKVNIIDGDGTLFWNRGMYTAWEEAAKGDFDFYLWINDDIEIFNGAIAHVLRESEEKHDKAVIVGSMRASSSETVTYGGRFKKRGGVITPNGEMQLCDTCNGNFLLVPKAVFDKVGNLDWTYHHSMGDLDYGFAVRRAGFELLVSSKYIGICDTNTSIPKWQCHEVALCERIKALYSPLSCSDPKEYFHFEKKNIGIATALKHLITIHLHVLFPRLWNKIKK